MRLIETIKRDLKKQKLICQQEQAKLERLEDEYNKACIFYYEETF